MLRRVAPRICFIFLILAYSGCGPARVHRQRRPPESAEKTDTNSQYLKVHLKDGGLYVLRSWKLEPDTIRGRGVLFDQYRDTVAATGWIGTPFAVAKSSVAIIETNSLTTESITPFTVVSIAHVLMTVFCILNPKTCFGSCPTFYVNQDGRELLMGEGFSSSISPSLEAEDVDALYRLKPASRALDITMKNEALETHVVKYVDVLAVPRHSGSRVFRSDEGGYWESSHISEPVACIASEGSILNQIQSLDGIERRSWTDSNDLGKEEVIDLTFEPNANGEYGLVIAGRQTFVSTFLFYQGMSYMGTSAGEYYARLERGDSAFVRQFENFKLAVGGIEVWAETTTGAWVEQGELTEEGPIATDVHLIKLKAGGSPQHIRLKMAQGSWRLDWLALATLDGSVRATRIHPMARVQIQHQTILDKNGSGHLQSKGALITLPGDEHRYSFTLPEHPDSFEYFLSTRGYYLEWMREDWLWEENPMQAAIFFLNPKEALKTNAGKFKQLEQAMEVDFWNSKIAGAAQ